MQYSDRNFHPHSVNEMKEETMRNLEILIASMIYFALFSSAGMTTDQWTAPLLIYSNNGGDAQHPCIAVDNKYVKYQSLFDEVEGYGRPHIVWSAKENNVWKTFYRVIDYDGTISNITEVQKEVISENPLTTIDYISDQETWPFVMVDYDDDKADIAFCHMKTGWYYDSMPIGNSTPVREILLSWKSPVIFLEDYIDPPHNLHHISGLQKGVRHPCLTPMAFWPYQIYYKAAVWSQLDDSGELTGYINCQAGAANDARSHIDWGESCRGGYPGIATGEHPYAATAIDATTGDPSSNQTYALAIASESDGSIVLSRLLVPGMQEPFNWATITLDPPRYTTYSLPSCAFDYPSDSTDQPSLYLAFRSSVALSLDISYKLVQVEDIWTGNPSFGTVTTLHSHTTVRQSRPVIAFSEDNTRYIAYIGDSDHVYVDTQKDDDCATDDLSGETDDIEWSCWVHLAVDKVSLDRGLYPQVVYDVHDQSNNHKIYWKRLYKTQ
jgi:hypothetical protein